MLLLLFLPLLIALKSLAARRPALLLLALLLRLLIAFTHRRHCSVIALLALDLLAFDLRLALRLLARFAEFGAFGTLGPIVGFFGLRRAARLAAVIVRCSHRRNGAGREEKEDG